MKRVAKEESGWVPLWARGVVTPLSMWESVQFCRGRSLPGVHTPVVATGQPSEVLLSGVLVSLDYILDNITEVDEKNSFSPLGQLEIITFLFDRM